jgi:hypothetical protein
VIRAADAERAVQTVHQRFGLSGDVLEGEG